MSTTRVMKWTWEFDASRVVLSCGCNAAVKCGLCCSDDYCRDRFAHVEFLYLGNVQTCRTHRALDDAAYEAIVLHQKHVDECQCLDALAWEGPDWRAYQGQVQEELRSAVRLVVEQLGPLALRGQF